MIGESKAIEIAKNEIKGKMECGPENPITVALEGQNYVVTFGMPPDAPLVPGADYVAQVTLDAKTGKVAEVLVGS